MKATYSTLIAIGLSFLLSGCVLYSDKSKWSEPVVARSPLQATLDNIPELDGEKITIAVYNFLDKTGQRKPNNKFSNLSSAITQGSEVWVINALQKVGKGTWFTVVERVGLDNLVKERQLIRSTREVYDGKNAPKLKPMLFAGLLLEGGVVGYESNLESGGVGARYFGIGANTEYRVDQVTISMRIIAVQTGEVLLTVATEKRIASYKTGADLFRFLDLGTKALELEAGSAVNEPVNYAVRMAIEAGIVEIIKQGENKKLWKYKVKRK
jgi:curli production assembly/transport component CsgG|tara:strand:- start:979 stop:1782 length:804 start_codon:yes stop_codon:yes gene_type:complete